MRVKWSMRSGAGTFTIMQVAKTINQPIYVSSVTLESQALDGGKISQLYLHFLNSDFEGVMTRS